MEVDSICCDLSSSSDNSSRSGSTFTSSSSSAPNGNLRQVGVALAICFICISGGNLVGYTSSAIPSIRSGNANVSLPFLQKLQNSFASDGVDTLADEVAVEVEKVNKFLDDSEGLKTDEIETDEFLLLTDTQASWIGGLAPLGAFFGSLIAPILINGFGPKGSLLKLGVPLYAISWLGTAFAPTILYIYLTRMIGGIAMGITFSAVPIYIVDTSSLELRGPLGTLSQFLFTAGVLISFILGYFFDWRMLAVICTFILLPAIPFLLIIPESPAWLLSKGRSFEAQDAFSYLHGTFNESNFYHKLSFHNQEEKLQTTTFASNSKFLSAGSVRSIMIALFLCVFQQLTGINAVNFYTVTIFEISAGQNSSSSYLDGHSSAIIVAFVFCFTNSCSYFLIERLGRKRLLLASTFFLSLSTFSLGLYFYLREVKGFDGVFMPFVPLLSLIVFVLAFSIGYGPLLYVIIAEILPSRIRTVVTPIAVGINWLCVFLVAKTFPGLLHVLQAYGSFWLYSTCSLISFTFTWFYLPETKGKTEVEIVSYFEAKGKRKMEYHETETATTQLSLIV